MPALEREPDSPCVGICRLNSADICTGCGRRVDEIATWAGCGPIRKRQIIAAARARLAALQSPTPVHDPAKKK